MELVELDGEDNDNDEEFKEVNSGDKPLDPRAGKVNVDIPQIPFDPSEIANLLTKNKFNEKSTTLCRKHMSKLIEQLVIKNDFLFFVYNFFILSLDSTNLLVEKCPLALKK